MEKIVYEYKVVILGGQADVQEHSLNDLGRAGWKLVNVAAVYDGELDEVYFRGYFIREKS